jgi:hypothetical protein
MSVLCCAMLCIPVSGHHQLAVSILRAEVGAYRFVRNLGAEDAESGVLWNVGNDPPHRTAWWCSPQHSSLSASHELYLDTGNASMTSVQACSRCLAQVTVFLSLNRFIVRVFTFNYARAKWRHEVFDVNLSKDKSAYEERPVKRASKISLTSRGRKISGLTDRMQKLPNFEWLCRNMKAKLGSISLYCGKHFPILQLVQHYWG